MQHQKAISNEFPPSIANRDQTAVRPAAYKGSKKGTIDETLSSKYFLDG